MKHPAGFTLIEITITLAIFAAMTVVAGIAYFEQPPDGIAQQGMEEMRSVINLARSYAVTGRTCCGDVVPFGYGVHYEMSGTDDRLYTLYADVDGDFRYVQANDESIQTGTLPQNVSFVQCGLGSATVTGIGTCDVLFSRQGFEQSLYGNGVLMNAPDEIILQSQHKDIVPTTSDIRILPHSLVIQ